MGKSIKLVILIVVVLVAVGAYYFYQPTPASGPGVEVGFQELNAIWGGNGIDMSDFDYDEVAIEALSVIELNSLKSSLISFKSENSVKGSLSELADIHVTLVDFSLKSKQFKVEATKVSALAEEDYCANTALFEARNAIGAEKVVLLQGLVQKIESFNEKYSQEAEELGLALAAYNLGEIESDQELMEFAVDKLKQTCAAGIV